MHKVSFSNFEQFGALTDNDEDYLHFSRYAPITQKREVNIEKKNKRSRNGHNRSRSGTRTTSETVAAQIPQSSSISQASTHSSISKQIIPAVNCNKETIVIIDWDDTLFPTTWVTANGINVSQASSLTPEQRLYFMKLDVIIYRFITQLMNYGKVFIVTNAMGEWINVTKKLLPNTTTIFKWVKVISARDMYSSKYPHAVDAWKYLCFQKVARKYMSKQKINNIISIGDAEYEYEALINLYRLGKQKKYLKSIKLLGGTDYNQIVDQIIVLNSNIREIINHDNHLDLVFTSKN